jgi:hypothetical protein
MNGEGRRITTSQLRNDFCEWTARREHPVACGSGPTYINTKDRPPRAPSWSHCTISVRDGQMEVLSARNTSTTGKCSEGRKAKKVTAQHDRINLRREVLSWRPDLNGLRISWGRRSLVNHARNRSSRRFPIPQSRITVNSWGREGLLSVFLPQVFERSLGAESNIRLFTDGSEAGDAVLVNCVPGITEGLFTPKALHRVCPCRSGCLHGNTCQ